MQMHPKREVILSDKVVMDWEPFQPQMDIQV